ncbi:MAG TPA: enoyl-CoA hydratase/isomerase family protein [Pyrinomonadaceae bacterium]|jgi:enoyl-CoA hydratase|nr:enoyl-CoA hydratase/isomerase family protein [Pyrinomonadaceae bacterium]
MTDGAHESDGDAHDDDAVRVEMRDTVAIVRLNRPAERNALSIQTLEELDATVSALDAAAHVSAIIFTGTGDVFASGANIRELRALTPATAAGFAARGQRLMQRIADAKALTIAAVNGYCMGGALDLALACDLRCASPRAVFAHPGARLGIITGWGGTQRLPRLVGATRALQMFATAKRLNAREAQEIGLVNRLGEDALACALALAQTLDAADIKNIVREVRRAT